MRATDKSVQLIIFEAVETALANLKTDKVIFSVEIFNSQTDFENEERPRLYPFVMVDIRVAWQGVPTHNSYAKDIVQNKQNGEATITIHTIFESLYDETKSFKQLEPIRHLIFRDINGVSDNDYFTHFERQSSEINTSHGRVIDYIDVFTATVTQWSLTKEMITIEGVELNIIR